MTKYQRLSIVLTLVLLLALALPGFAQRGDRDGDGLPDSVDNCPDQPGPRENGGCPRPDNTGGETPDRDGDGVLDFVDLCPDQPGTGFTEGCPDDLTGDAPNPAPNSPPQVTFTWGSLQQCMVGLFPSAPSTVRIRENPSTSAQIIGFLLPGQQFEPFFRDYDANGNLWFGGAPAGGDWGWVFAGVVANNGYCDSLPMVIPIGAPFAFDLHLSLDPDSLSDPIPYLQYKLDRVFIKSWSTSGDADDRPAPGGGVETTDSWDQPTYFVHFTLFNPDGTPVRDDPHFSPLLFAYQGDSTPTDDCVDIGEGVCLIAGLLLPAFGDEPGQCPPQAFERALQAAYGDGDTDGADFLVWQKNLGAGDASDFGLLLPASDPDAAQSTPKLLESVANGKVYKLFLPAVQALMQGASDANGVDIKNNSAYVQVHGDEASDGSNSGHIEFVWEIEEGESVLPMEQVSMNFEQINWERQTSCAVIGFVPGGDGAVMGDGSVMPSFQSVALLLPALPAAQ